MLWNQLLRLNHSLQQIIQMDQSLFGIKVKKKQAKSKINFLIILMYKKQEQEKKLMKKDKK